MREPAAAVERVHRTRTDARDGNHERVDAVVARRSGLARDDDQLVDRVAFDDVPLLARQHRMRLAEHDRGGHGRGIERPPLLGDRE